VLTVSDSELDVGDDDGMWETTTAYGRQRRRVGDDEDVSSEFARGAGGLGEVTWMDLGRKGDEQNT